MTNGFETQQCSQNSPWMSWSQPQFGLHKLSLESRNLNNCQLFNDEYVEVIELQMPQNVEDSRNMSMKGEVEVTTMKEGDLGKKNGGRAIASKLKETLKNKVKVDQLELEDSEGE